MSIKWTESGGYGVEGHVPECDLNMFKIYLPGDPCNRTKTFELIVYTPRFVRSNHDTLAEAKAHANKLYRAEFPRPKRASIRWENGWFGPLSRAGFAPVNHKQHTFYFNVAHDGYFRLVDNTLGGHKETGVKYKNMGSVKRAARRLYTAFLKNGGLNV
jgi:hypothetical protein